MVVANDLGQVSLKLNGTLELAIEQDNLLDVTIEQDLFLPDALTLRIADIADQPTLSASGHFQLLDQDKFRIGAEIEVGMGHVTPTRIFVGEITSIELDIADSGYPTLIVRGFDRSHRMRRDRRTKAWVNVSDTDIARSIAGTYSLTADVTDSRTIHPHVFQDNQTDWDFLRARAARIGYDLFVRNRALHFQTAGGNTPVIPVTYGDDLLQVRVRLSAQSQVNTVTVRGWNETRKQAVVGTASRAVTTATVGETKTGKQLASSFGAGSYVQTERAVTTQDEANTRAQAIYESINGDLYQVDGACYGNATLVPGSMIELKNIGTRFSGKYYVSSVTHRRRRGEPYVASFIVNGRRPATLSGALAPSLAARPNDAPTSHQSVVIGVVSDVKDPDNLGRIKLTYPWLDGGGGGTTPVASNWARLASPMGGSGRGMIWLPEVNDEVLVAFEHGDINRPYVLGGLWNGIDQPPTPVNASNTTTQLVGATGKVDRRLIKSRLGHIIVLDDSETTPQMLIKSKAGHTVVIDDTPATPRITITSKAGHSVKLDDTAATPNVTIVDKNNNIIKIDSLTNSMTIKCTGNMNIEATGTLGIKGTTVNIEATAAFTVKGNASGSVESNGLLNVRGNLVKIN